MKKRTTTNTSIWVSTCLIFFVCFSANAQDCLFTTSYEIIDLVSNGDGTCDYTIDLCAEVDENAAVHSIEYTVLFDGNGDGEEESILSYNFTPGIQILGGTYCLSSSAPAQTFTITTPCGNNVMLVITGINNETNEECINLIEDVVLEMAEEEDIAEMYEEDVTLLPQQANEFPTTSYQSNAATYPQGYILYPSLAEAIINIQIEEAYEIPVSWMITDLKGQVLLNVMLEAGRTEKQVAVDQLHSGHYFLVPKDGAVGLSTQRFLKL